MKVILVNVKKTDRYHGYWYASANELEDVDYVVGHDNENLLNVYELDGFYESLEMDNRKEFILKRISSRRAMLLKKALRNVKLKGLQGVKYELL